jgi:hypothetical protein
VLSRISSEVEQVKPDSSRVLFLVDGKGREREGRSDDGHMSSDLLANQRAGGGRVTWLAPIGFCGGFWLR